MYPFSMPLNIGFTQRVKSKVDKSYLNLNVKVINMLYSDNYMCCYWSHFDIELKDVHVCINFCIEGLFIRKEFLCIRKIMFSFISTQFGFWLRMYYYTNFEKNTLNALNLPQNLSSYVCKLATFSEIGHYITGHYIARISKYIHGFVIL